MSMTLKSKLLSAALHERIFTQRQVLAIVTGIKATDIQNWTNRSLLGAAFLERGRGNRRLYSIEDCLLLAIALRLRTVGFSISEAIDWILKDWSAKASLATLARNAARQLARGEKVAPMVLLEISEFGEPLQGLRYNLMAHELVGPSFEMDVFHEMRSFGNDHLIFIDLVEVVHRVIDGVQRVTLGKASRDLDQEKEMPFC